LTTRACRVAAARTTKAEGTNARKLRDNQFENLATLFTQATAQLCQIVEMPYTIYFDQAFNCVTVLTRVVPLLLKIGDLGERIRMWRCFVRVRRRRRLMVTVMALRW